MKSVGKSVPPHAVGVAVLADTQTFEGPNSRASVRSRAISRVTCLGLGVALATFLCACGRTSTPFAIAITTASPSSMEIGQTASIAATVSGDPSNAGVDWSCNPAPSCGTFTPTHTASGATTTYQAPNTAETVTLTADATTKPTVNAAATVTINPIGATSSLNGAYTFFANGWDSTTTAAPFPASSVAGSVVIDGANGTITGGEEDFFDSTAASPITQDDPISPTGSSISLGSDGRGTLTLQLQHPNSLGHSTETFSIVLVNNKHLLITAFDGGATSAGSLDLQTSPASVPTNGNAFVLYDAADRVVLGGVLTSNGSAITAGEGDDNDFSLPAPSPGLTLSGSLSATDPAGRGTTTITFTDPSTKAAVASLECAYYVVGPEAFRLIEIDGSKFAAGSMYGQGNTSGAFSATSLGGSFAFVLSGQPIDAAFYGAAGEFATNSSPTSPALTSGVADVNMGDGAPLSAAPLAAGSSYSLAADGYGSLTLSGTNTDGLAAFGVYMVDPVLNLADPNNTSGGGGALMLDMDLNSLGIGRIVPQSTGASFLGNYAFVQNGAYLTNTAEGDFDILGQVLSDGTSQLAGKADYNDVDGTGLNPNIGLSGTFTPDAANPGRSTAQITLSGQAAPSNLTTNNITMYQASSSLLFHVDMDSPSPGTGVIAVGAIEKQQ